MSSQCLFICRHRIKQVLISQDGQEHADPHLAHAQLLARALQVLLDRSAWPEAPASPNRHPVDSIMCFLCEHSLFPLLAALLHFALPTEAAVAPTTMESIAATLLSAWPSDGRGCTARDAWVLLAVPALLERAPRLLQHAHTLAAATLQSCDCSAAQLQRALVHHCASLGYRSDHESLSIAVAHCALQLLSNLLQVLHQPGLPQITATQTLVFLSTSRALLAMAPPQARQVLVQDSVRALSGGAQCRIVIQRSTCSHAGGRVAFESNDEAFSGSEWYLPQLPRSSETPEVRHAAQAHAVQRDSHRAMNVDGATDMPEAPSTSSTAQASDAIVFTTSLASPQLLARLASATLAATSDSLAARLQRATELALWLFMLLALSSSDDVVRQQLETAWIAPALDIVRMLWANVIRPAVAEGHSEVWPEGPLAGVGMWVLPLAALCSLYSHFVSTASNDRLFSETVRSSPPLLADNRNLD